MSWTDIIRVQSGAGLPKWIAILDLQWEMRNSPAGKSQNQVLTAGALEILLSVALF